MTNNNISKTRESIKKSPLKSKKVRFEKVKLGEQLLPEASEEMLVNSFAKISEKERSASYFSQKNVKDFFQKIIVRNIFLKDNPSNIMTDIITNPILFNREALTYFKLCDKYEMNPTIASFSAFMGVRVPTLMDAKVNPNCPCSSIIARCFDVIHAVAQQAVMDNKLNPVTYMYLSGNYFEMKDTRNVNLGAIIDNSSIGTSEKEQLLKTLKEQNSNNFQENKNDVLEATFTEN